MPRSICVHPDHKPTLGLTLQRSGFLTQGDLAAHLQIALSTVSNFFRGINVSVSKFEEICEALGLEPRTLIVPRDNSSHEQLGAQNPTQPAMAVTCFAYDAAWVGRQSILQDLSQRLQGSCRLLLLTGLSGIGKTALAERLLIEQIQIDPPTLVLRENFDAVGEAIDFSNFAIRLLEQCGQVVLPGDRSHLHLLMQYLICYLQQHPCWLIMDSLEELLQGNEHEGWSELQDEGFVQFFQKVLSVTDFQSRLIVTSQELPGQITQIGSRYQTVWYNCPLTGLTEIEQLDLFEKTGLSIQSETGYRSELIRIGSAYEGHPLALRVIAGEIGNLPFYGQVKAYWNKYGKEIEEVEQAIAAARTGNQVGAADQWRLDRFTRLLRQQVRSRLEKTFTRLRQDVRFAYYLLCETAVYRCAVPEEWWLSHLEDWDCDDINQQFALEALKERYLVEESIDNEQYLLRQHNLIRSISLEHLKHLSL